MVFHRPFSKGTSLENQKGPERSAGTDTGTSRPSADLDRHLTAAGRAENGGVLDEETGPIPIKVGPVVGARTAVHSQASR
jgi:hypothetical protein